MDDPGGIAPAKPAAVVESILTWLAWTPFFSSVPTTAPTPERSAPPNAPSSVAGSNSAIIELAIAVGTDSNAPLGPLATQHSSPMMIIRCETSPSSSTVMAFESTGLVTTTLVYCCSPSTLNVVRYESTPGMPPASASRSKLGSASPGDASAPPAGVGVVSPAGGGVASPAGAGVDVV